ncbi:Acyl-homoserine-lactone synthase [Ephemeroptericola cinctiostellae]|uniref:Acyl-homoserine-lactone synthase n=1 Tax=Ephemeroptericola cinctiostellae TaxID=2268024 RepID=A0A345DEB9_9BURK|nr:acyl-homoserine-lactone synthase [Ephemeroptericola cinctiostellae]AXF86707.1 Acyl-homoserine-lactone synthase [Ephemeroptericola cinctiostellae]
MNISLGMTHEFSDNDFSQLSAYRHKVFIETLGWSLPTQSGIERDQFDRPDTRYIVVKDNAGHICGCARLLPTTSPYLLGEVFPQLLNGQSIPNSPDIWEISRFSTIDFHSPSMSMAGAHVAPAAIALIHQTVKYAKTCGAKRLIAVGSVGIERLLRQARLKVHRTGAPMVADGEMVCGFWVEI